MRKEKLGEFKKLVEDAASELRKEKKAGGATRRLADYFNNFVTKRMFGTPRSFKRTYWGKIARAMGETSDVRREGTLFFWVVGLGGMLSLATVRGQHLIEQQELFRRLLAFYDAVELVD